MNVLTIKIPHFSYIINSPHHQHFRRIVANGDVIDRIDNLNEFYKEFGYTSEIAKTGIVADEFIWEHYVKNKDNDFDACLQMHIVEYLNKHSLIFKELYAEQYESYVNSHIAAREARGYKCYACKHLPFCKNES